MTVKTDKKDTTGSAEREKKLDDKLDSLGSQIVEEIAKQQESAIFTGGLLQEAHSLLSKKPEGSQEKFVNWVKEIVGLGKSQAYKLMNIHNTFGESSEFHGISMRVLYNMRNQSKDVIDACKVLAISNKLDNESLDKTIKLLSPDKIDAPPKITKKPGKEIKSGVEEALKKKVAELELKLKEDKPDASEDTGVIEALRGTVSSLESTIGELKEQLKEKKKTKPTLPALPQFSSVQMHTRLGLESAAAKDKKKVNKAYRALSKMYPASVNKKAAKQLIEARELLLKGL